MWEYAADESLPMTDLKTCNDITDGSSEVFVSPEWVKSQIEAEAITVLDARGANGYAAGHLSTAVHAAWQSFTLGCPGTTCGVLSPADNMKAVFASLGVSPKVPVVV
jgi:3-mercaptopyruvate sulfurtransferase SseA